MDNSTSLTQTDVDYLFRIDFANIDEIPLESAGRLLLLNLVQESLPLHGGVRVAQGDAEEWIGVSHNGRMFMAAVRAGIETDYREWKP